MLDRVAKSYKKKMKLRKKEKKEKKSQTRIEIFDELQVKHDVHQMLHDVHAMLKTNGTLLQVAFLAALSLH
ncbi:hypothetical protein GUITHDRAFT_112761 [Guillardia theta CCMP2712]|uniref:Uncharacterized protein n=1 Tax=Guillardia theta (strain CCMP2712) TaxID=905079 RepID=L1IZS1_GUITC|nr:hypothetical protein GUITHDRAFT_112761 [Guillardia theta CCMP2712]EKX41300.1 hypothetical protein GUITHDRAFT_112761 [Guillardia theta CCMP2712]|eukprot:XP_005828280.1 hypothetical protein GUITHDRAFT_112761 [Guillardia theta CCMP2712]